MYLLLHWWLPLTITGGAVIWGIHGHCHGHNVRKVRMLLDLCPSRDNGEHSVWGVNISDFDQTFNQTKVIIDELQHKAWWWTLPTTWCVQHQLLAKHKGLPKLIQKSSSYGYPYLVTLAPAHAASYPTQSLQKTQSTSQLLLMMYTCSCFQCKAKCVLFLLSSLQ